MSSDYNKTPIRLIMCSAGACELEDVHGLAQALANKMRVTVIAPTDILTIYVDGSFSIGPGFGKTGGEWREFKPMPRKKRKK